MSFKTTKIISEDKGKFYHLLAQQAQGLLSVENDRIANAANLCSLLYHSLEEVNWVGFYFVQGSELVLGPFQGQVACTRINIGEGVCGTAFRQNKTLRVDDVHAFKGHIACDTASNSELVLPLAGLGVLDIDSPVFQRFDALDQSGCEQIANIYLKSTT